ncbi:MAG: tetratricopeptide repeat protein [Bryobacteraceae bacterium]|nr:tetratricopeptide repeat protein [Bryobacteraceae bacterium]
MSARIEALTQMLAQDPANTFARYGLAMAHLGDNRAEDAIREFRVLLEKNPDYAAAYFHGGRALEMLSQLDEARALYERGIEVTTRTGDSHTRAELQAALDILG